MHLCAAEELLTGACPSGHQKLLMKKQMSRVAARRSRQRHTDKADALHQQFESLERHNQALRREIQALRNELVSWSRTLQAHERLCLTDCTARVPPVPPGCWGPAEQPPGPAPYGPHQSREQPGLFLPPPVSSTPCPQPAHGAPSTLLSSPSSLSLGPAQLTSPSGASQLRPLSELSALLPCLAAPPQPLKVKLGTSSFSPSLAPELAIMQGQEQPVLAAVDWLDEDPDPQHLQAFPLLSSAQVLP